MSRLVRLSPLLVLLIFIGAAIVYSDSLQTRARIGAPAPEFQLQDMSGEEVRLEDFRGQPVVINFWATWCTTCRAERPGHEAFYQRYGHQVTYLSINQREPRARVERHLQALQSNGDTMSMPILLDSRGTVSGSFRMTGVPETWLIDGEGVARQRWVGLSTFEQLETTVQQVLDEPAVARGGSASPTAGPLHAVVAAPAHATGTNGLYIARDHGVVHVPLGEQDPEKEIYLEEHNIFALARDPSGATAVWAATPEGVTRLEPSGTTTQLPDLPEGPRGLAVAPDGNALAWLPDHGLHHWDGHDWSRLSTNLPHGLPWLELSVNPSNPDQILGAGPAGLMESRDGGWTWRETGLGKRVYAARHDPNTPRRILLATDQGVWVSDDGGRSAQWLTASPQRVLVALDLVMQGDDPPLILAGAPNGDVYRSMDAGASWELVIPRL